MNFHVVFGAAILVIQLARGLRISPIIPSTTTTLLLHMYSLRALALSGEVLRTAHSLSFAGSCNIIDQLFFRRVFLTCTTDFPQKEELHVVQRILRGYKQFIITIQCIYYNLKGMSNIFSIFEKAPFSAYLNFVKQDLVSMTVNLKFSIFNGNGVQMKGSSGESCDQYVKGIVCVVLGTRCNLTKGLSKHA